MRSPIVRLVLCATPCLIALSVLPAGAGTSFSPLDEGVLEQTALVPAAESVTAFTAPLHAKVVLTRFCGDDCVRCEGATLGRKAFESRGGRCVVHRPGIELPPGETVRCTNRCETMGAVLFSGVTRP